MRRRLTHIEMPVTADSRGLFAQRNEMAVKKRLVINFTGYEGLHPDAVRGRYLNSSADFNSLWHAKTRDRTDEPAGQNIAPCKSKPAALNWQPKRNSASMAAADIFDAYARETLPRVCHGTDGVSRYHA